MGILWWENYKNKKPKKCNKLKAQKGSWIDKYQYFFETSSQRRGKTYQKKSLLDNWEEAN